MSKAFEKWLDNWFDPDDGGNHGDTAEAAWNAALDRAIEIVEEQEGCITDSSALLIRREKTE